MITIAQAILPVIQLIVMTINLIVLVYGGYKFLNKPHDTLEARVTATEKRLDEHDLKFKQVDETLEDNDGTFKEQKELNEVFINCMLAFIDFEMAYCSATGYKDTEDLDNAKATLRKYLAKR